MQINSKKLKREMELQGLTPAALAGRLKITRQGIGIMLARKTTTLQTLTKIAKVLDIDPKDLLI